MRGAGRRRVLGALERAVLERLWQGDACDVRTMHEAVGAPRGLASNTIQSTLERLHRKGLVAREKQGRAYRYRARVSRRAWVEEELREVLARAGGDDARVVLAAFVDLAARAGEDELAELERLIRARRAQRSDGS